jgi:tetratricopeptide (TPR) repeat protein
MLKQVPQDRKLTMSKERLALNYFTKQEYDKAAVIYSELYSESPRQYYYNYYLRCLIYLNDYKEAEKLIKRHRKTSSSGYSLDVDLAYVEDLLGNQKKSRKIIDNLTSKLPQNRSLIIRIASALQGKGYYEDALHVYEKARQIPANNYSFDMELATAYQFTGDYDKMFDLYLEYLKSHPDEVQIVRNKMQMIINRDVDDNLSDILKKKLLEKSQQNPDNLIYANMLLWYSMQTKDFDLAFKQARAIDMRFKDHDDIMLEVADVALSNRQYAIASQAYDYLKTKKEASPFYLNACTGYFIASVKEANDKPETTEKQYKKIEKTGDKTLEELGLNAGTIDIAGYLAHIKAFNLGKTEEASQLLDRAIKIPSATPVTKSRLKLELADILLFKDKVWDATLLYSQVEAEMKNEPIGYEAKFRNAQLFYFIGEYDWAKAKLDILKSATSKLIANDALELSLFIKNMLEEDSLGSTLQLFSKSDLSAYQDNYDSAYFWLTKIENQSPGLESYQYMIYKKADLMMKMHEYLQADSLYDYLSTYYPESIKADNAIFKRAELNRENLNNPSLAMQLYMVLMKDYPESIYAGESRKKYRELRKVSGIENEPIEKPTPLNTNNP